MFVLFTSICYTYILKHYFQQDNVDFVDSHYFVHFLFFLQVSVTRAFWNTVFHWDNVDFIDSHYYNV